MTSELSRDMTSEECFCNLKIVNLSSKELTEGQIKLLSKGLKFTPTPKKDMCEISADIQNFCTKLRKKEFYLVPLYSAVRLGTALDALVC